MAKPPGICIFCGKGGMTKQHVWPDWLKLAVPRSFARHSQIYTHMDLQSVDRPLVSSPIVKSKQGDPAVKKVRKVCKSCNSGWMSRLETAAKPVLTPIIRGKNATLSALQREAS